MIVWFTIEATCPACGNRIRLREVGSGFALGQDSDLLLRMDGKHLIQVEVHTCSRCHFSGYAADFHRDLLPQTVRRFLDEVSPTLVEGGPPLMETRSDPGRTPLPDIQYYWAYRTASAVGLSAIEEGERLLRAYWCLRIPPSANLPPVTLRKRKRLYLNGAIRKLRKGLQSASDRNFVYLIGELCRRNKNFLLSKRYFRRFLDREPGARYLKHAASKLLRAAAEGISQEMSMEELLYDNTPGSSAR